MRVRHSAHILLEIPIVNTSWRERKRPPSKTPMWQGIPFAIAGVGHLLVCCLIAIPWLATSVTHERTSDRLRNRNHICDFVIEIHILLVGGD